MSTRAFVDGINNFLFNFEKPHTSGTKIGNVFSVFGVNLVWLFLIFLFLSFIAGLRSDQISNIMAPLFLNSISSSIPRGLMHSPVFMFFLACVMAPIWEEWCFRLAPIKLAQLLTGVAQKLDVQVKLIGATAVAFAIFFGLLHGYGAISILIQGVGGLLFCWLYLKNNNSYLSCVFAHSLWNFMVIFGLPLIMHN